MSTAKPQALDFVILINAILTFAAAGPAPAVVVSNTSPSLVVGGRCLIASLVLFILVCRHYQGILRQLGRHGTTLLAIQGVLLSLHLVSYVGGVRYATYVSAMTLVSL